MLLHQIASDQSVLVTCMDPGTRIGCHDFSSKESSVNRGRLRMTDYLSNITQLVFGQKFGIEISVVFRHSSEARRNYIVGTIVLIITASVRLRYLFWADRHATLAGCPDAEALSACGLHADTAGDAAGRRLRCFHCDLIADFPATAAASDSEAWAAHRAGSPACFLARLGALVHAGAPEPPGLQVDARRYQMVLRRLRQLLESPVIAAAADYGFEANYLRLCAARHFMLNECATVARPGDLIRLAQEAEDRSVLPAGAAARVDLLRLLDAAPDAVSEVPVQPQPQPQPQPELFQPPPLDATAGVVAVDSPTPAEAADDRCVQCRSRTRNRVTLPCAHFLLCDRCLESLARCPKCNRAIVATVTAFIT